MMRWLRLLFSRWEMAGLPGSKRSKWFLSLNHKERFALPGMGKIVSALPAGILPLRAKHFPDPVAVNGKKARFMKECSWRDSRRTAEILLPGPKSGQKNLGGESSGSFFGRRYRRSVFKSSKRIFRFDGKNRLYLGAFLKRNPENSGRGSGSGDFLIRGRNGGGRETGAPGTALDRKA